MRAGFSLEAESGASDTIFPPTLRSFLFFQEGGEDGLDWESAVSGFSLAMDAFAVSVCMGACIPGRFGRASLRMGGACGLFQFLMPLGGWAAGEWSAGLMAALDHWLAFGLLAFVGGGMIRSALGPSNHPCEGDATASPRALFSLALATSIDAFVVGAGFALVKKPVLDLALLAGVFTALTCVLGVCIGRFVGCRFGRRVELIGGVLLILIGLNILLTHLMDHGGLEWVFSANGAPVMTRKI